MVVRLWCRAWLWNPRSVALWPVWSDPASKPHSDPSGHDQRSPDHVPDSQDHRAQDRGPWPLVRHDQHDRPDKPHRRCRTTCDRARHDQSQTASPHEPRGYPWPRAGLARAGLGSVLASSGHGSILACHSLRCLSLITASRDARRFQLTSTQQVSALFHAPFLTSENDEQRARDQIHESTPASLTDASQSRTDAWSICPMSVLSRASEPAKSAYHQLQSCISYYDLG